MLADKKKIRLLIVDDHALIRDGLKTILAFHNDIEVVGEAAEGDEAYRYAMEMSPDIVLMDINMPGVNGIDATKRIKTERPEIGIIALTIHDDEEYVVELVKAGVSSYVLKDIDTNTLVETIRTVAKGETFFHPKIAGKLLGEFKRLSGSKRDPLSKREHEVLVMITRGKNNREIGEELFISEKTVKNHLTNIFRKIDVSDRTQAALYAVKNRLVKL
jgi:two-component system, NarL family, response regulator DegU